MVARLTSAGPLDQSYLLDDLDAHFSELVAFAEPLIAAETGFVCPTPARAKILSRPDWASANVDSMLALMRPLLDRVEERIALAPGSQIAKLAYRPILGAQLGGVLGYLSTKVLGQYDLLLGHEDNVWFVGPNIVLMEKKFGFIPRDFRLWIVLHELTHRAQFEGNAWMRQHFLDSVTDLIGSMDVDARTLLQRVMQAVTSSSESPLGVRLLSPQVQEKFSRMQAFMTIVEGHGNFIMDRLAEGHIPTQPRMRKVLRGAGTSGGPLSKLIAKALGLEMKRAQYEEGQAFLDAIFAAGGSEAVARCLSGPEMLPTIEEIRSAPLWMARVAV